LGVRRSLHQFAGKGLMVDVPQSLLGKTLTYLREQ
jgi:hypothetical protein